MADSVSKFSFVEVWLKKTADMMNSYKLISPFLKFIMPGKILDHIVVQYFSVGFKIIIEKKTHFFPLGLEYCTHFVLCIYMVHVYEIANYNCIIVPSINQPLVAATASPGPPYSFVQQSP